jgi:hypothetical protein
VFDPPKIKMKADPLLLRKLLYHAVRFLAFVSTDYGQVRVEMKGNDIHILFEFESYQKLKLLIRNPVAHIETLESIDARISFLVCMKMSQIHQGQTHLEHISGNTWALHLSLKKDFKL